MKESLLVKYLGVTTTDVSLEALNQKLEEIEYELYCKINDFDELKKAKSKEQQEQWTLFFNKKGVRNAIRVRKTVGKDGTKYELTSKVKIPGLTGDWEIETEVERKHFDIVKDLAETGMIKDRYFFPIDGTDLIWEVDVFKNLQGEIQPWVKLDLEVHKEMATLPPTPIEGSDWILEQYSERSPETIDKLDKVFKEHFQITK